MAADTDNRNPEQISLTRFLRERLRRRQDSEHEQAFVRVVIVLILAAYYLILAVLNDFTVPSFSWGFYWASGYLVLSLVLFAVAGWALSAGHPGMAPSPFASGVFALGLTWFFFTKRQR